MSDSLTEAESAADEHPLANLTRAEFETLHENALGDNEFALCLTHDVDRPYKRHQAVYYALRDRSLSHLRALLPGHNPYWQFEKVMRLEDALGVRSAFYFLTEPNLLTEGVLRDWFDPELWVQFLGRYDVTAPDIVTTIRALDEKGWEVGLHGSILAHDDRERLAEEKHALETALDGPVRGGRQHYLRLEGTRTWRNHVSLGLCYDSSLGSSSEYGFEYGYLPQRPFDDEFVVFPLTVMETALPNPDTDPELAARACDRLLAEAAENGAVMTVLWHPRYFNDDEFPGYRRCYRRLLKRALDRNAWVGSPGQFYERLVGAATETWRSQQEIDSYGSF